MADRLVLKKKLLLLLSLRRRRRKRERKDGKTSEIKETVLDKRNICEKSGIRRVSPVISRIGTI